MKFIDKCKDLFKKVGFLQCDNSKTNYKLDKSYILIGVVVIVFLIGILIRVFGIQDMPNALNCDEASAGYEAYSILNYGIDRNGNKLPAFLVSWGSGQNVLLSYLSIPFIKIFGLSVLSVRLPMALVGCVSLIVMFLLLKRISNSKIALIGLIFFTICPWHIMKSRWGLESNLFPDLILIFTYLLVKGIEDKNKFLYYLSFVIAGISAYSYGTSYYFLPVFIIPLLIVLVRKKKIEIKQAIVSIIIVGIVSLPIILYVIINTFNLQQINLPFLTIPKLEVNRYKELTSIFSSGFLLSSFSNFIESLKILIMQFDELPWNSIYPFGTIYIYSTFFTIIGLINSFRKNRVVDIKYNEAFNIWFIVSIILIFICEPNINRLNIIMIPIIYYTIIGIFIVIESFSKRRNQMGMIVLISIVYLVSFVLFINVYKNQDFDEYTTFESDLQDVVEYIENIEDKEVFITDKIKTPYMYILFYTKYDVNDFIKTVQYEDKYVEFRNVLSFGRYHFEDIEELDNKYVYVIRKEDRKNYDLQQEKIKEIGKYIIIEQNT